MNLIALFFVLLFALPAAAFAGTATLTWTANTEADLAGYKVYRGTSACAAPSTVLTPLATVGKVVTYTDSTIPAFDGELCYEITAIDVAGNESAHSTRASKAVNLVPPSAPSTPTIGTVTP
jgi:hypothetical protein